MSKLTKALIAAAGNVGGAALYSEDVFSTYLYTGNGASQTIENGIALGDTFVGTSTLFDGSSDYLSRSSDLTGNSDSGTFTLSFWLRPTSLALDSYVYRSGTGFQFWVSSRDNGGVDVIGYDSGGSKRLEIGIAAGTCSVNSWTHVLVSVDLSDTGSRYVYINDAALTPSYFVYQNASINFTNTAHGIAADSTGGSKYTGYLAHFYLDYTYRNLSVEANRRYFIDGNGCATSEATQSALSPILYLPLTDSTTANSGTGGNFTANGSPSIEDKGVGYEAGYGSGGMVWVKGRDTAYDHRLFDTDRGAGKMLSSNNTAAEQTLTEQLEAFNADGFQVGNNLGINGSGSKYASWTFRKAEKFFDVVTFSGNGASSQSISHNLGSVPAMIITKSLNNGYRWNVWHIGLGVNTNPTYANMLFLQTTDQTQLTSSGGIANPTDTSFDVGGVFANKSGDTYVAYLFASDAGGFGDDGSENIIKCGSAAATGLTTVDCGFEPQWVLIKSATVSNSWYIFDSMRGLHATGVGPQTLNPNLSGAEYTESADTCNLTSTGFTFNSARFNGNATYIYIAIRRPMKTPESGTEVFAIDTAGSVDSNKPQYRSGFPVDMVLERPNVSGSENMQSGSRLTQGKFLRTNLTNAEAAFPLYQFDYMNGYYNSNTTIPSYYAWMFKRATGFFDVVAYTGDGLDGRTVDHNLKAVPELLIVKSRSSAYNWRVLYYDGATGLRLNLNDNSAATTATGSIWGNSSTFIPPTSTQFTVSNYSNVNLNNATFIAYLFATVAGVSKVGSYTGTGSNVDVDCGFSAGARFILIKRTDSTGDWYVWDSVRGIVAGNDPYLLLNSTAAEVTSTDYIDPLASGFTVTSSAPAALNASGGTYIFLAIA